MQESKTLTARINEFFGRRAGQTAAEFMAELKALTPADKAWFMAEFNAMGLPTVLANSVAPAK